MNHNRTFFKELESKIRHLRYNLKYSLEMLKTRGGGELLDVLLFNFKREKEFEVTLSITAIIKNEAPYIKEWIEFHKLVGVQKFFIYDNESTDNIKEVLAPYIENGDVVYKFFPGEKMQFAAYNDSIMENKYKTKYMAIIDLDEFIVPVKHNTIIEFIDDLQSHHKQKIAAIGLSWLIHGFNGHYKKVDGLLIEQYPKCDFNASASSTVKSIVNPRSILKIYNPHFALHVLCSKVVNADGENMHGPYTKPCFDKIRVNHYYTKSYEEHVKRIAKGKADGNIGARVLEYSPEYCSKDEDDAIKKYIEKVKQNVISIL